jgi:cyclopropane fatty-acyl-phospholipid synthase-like methyltransferase
MAEHVGVRRYGQFLRQVYDLLEDDGTLVFQVSGIRPQWQYEDLTWYAHTSNRLRLITDINSIILPTGVCS